MAKNKERIKVSAYEDDDGNKHPIYFNTRYRTFVIDIYQNTLDAPSIKHLETKVRALTRTQAGLELYKGLHVMWQEGEWNEKRDDFKHHWEHGKITEAMVAGNKEHVLLKIEGREKWVNVKQCYAYDRILAATLSDLERRASGAQLHLKQARRQCTSVETLVIASLPGNR